MQRTPPPSPAKSLVKADDPKMAAVENMFVNVNRSAFAQVDRALQADSNLVYAYCEKSNQGLTVIEKFVHHYRSKNSKAKISYFRDWLEFVDIDSPLLADITRAVGDDASLLLVLNQYKTTHAQIKQAKEARAREEAAQQNAASNKSWFVVRWTKALWCWWKKGDVQKAQQAENAVAGVRRNLLQRLDMAALEQVPASDMLQAVAESTPSIFVTPRSVDEVMVAGVMQGVRAEGGATPPATPPAAVENPSEDQVRKSASVIAQEAQELARSKKARFDTSDKEEAKSEQVIQPAASLPKEQVDAELAAAQEKRALEDEARKARERADRKERLAKALGQNSAPAAAPKIYVEVERKQIVPEEVIRPGKSISARRS